MGRDLVFHSHLHNAAVTVVPDFPLEDFVMQGVLFIDLLVSQIQIISTLARILHLSCFAVTIIQEQITETCILVCYHRLQRITLLVCFR